MSTWERLRVQLNIGILVGTCTMAGCAESKDPTSPAFDMSEYRKVMERQKSELAAQENADAPVPEMTAEEHERAGDQDAARRNFPLAGVH